MTVGSERGAALVIALVAITLLFTLAGAMVTQTVAETAIAANFRDGLAAFYAADAALEGGLATADASPDWNALVAGLPASADPAWRQLPAVPEVDGIAIEARVRTGPAAGLLDVEGRAATAGGARRVVQATIARGIGGVRRLSWHEER